MRLLFKLGFLCCAFGLAGCPLDQAETDLQSAVNQLDTQSASWQVTLQNLVDKLVQDGNQTIANQVTQLMQNGIATAGSEIRCDADFIGTQMKNGLIQLMSTIDSTIKAPPIIPAICQVVPSTINMDAPPDVVNFYGYNFSATGAGLNVVFDHDGTAQDATPFMTVVTPYLVTVNISQANGLPVCNDQNRSLVFQTGATPLSTVDFVAKTCAQGSFLPGPPAGPLPGYPRDYDIGPNLGGDKKNFTAGSPCTHGYVRVDPPQFANLTGNGNCNVISWGSSDPTDCTVNVHMGVSSLQSTQCQLSIDQVGQPVWVPPPPCTCQ